MTKYLFEVTSSYKGQIKTDRTFQPDKESAIKHFTDMWVKGVEVIKVEQLSFTPCKTGTPDIK